MNTIKMDDIIFEVLFSQAVIDDYSEEINSIPSIESLKGAISFSFEFESNMKKLLAWDQRRDFLVKVINYSRRVAIFIIATTTIFFYTLLLSSEVRAVVKNTIIELYDKFTSFIFQGETSDTDIAKEWRPEYIPVGYNEISFEKLGSITNIEYMNDEDNIIYLSYRPEGYNTNISIDNENHHLRSEIINGYEAYIAVAANDDFENGVIWSMKGIIFSIWSKLPTDELIKIVQSFNTQ